MRSISHLRSVVLAVKGIPKRTYLDLTHSLEHGGKGGVLCDGECVGVVGASVAPVDETIAAVGCGGEGGGVVGAVGRHFDNAHCLVVAGDSDGVTEFLLNIGKIVPIIIRLIC